MRRRYRLVAGKLVEIARRSTVPRETFTILEDIKPYKSIITGETISSRSGHREHLKVHDMQEVGTEIPPFLKAKYERDGTRPAWDRDGRRSGGR